jgi:hypothetical protein
MEEMFPGNVPQPFNSDDYENIRAVAGKFLGGIDFSTPKALDDFLIEHNFDRYPTR